MLGKSIRWLPVSFLLSTTLWFSAASVARSQEVRDFGVTRSPLDFNDPALTKDFLEAEVKDFVSPPVAQSETPSLETPPPTPSKPNLRRRPVGEEGEFTPENVPIRLPGLEEIEREETADSFYKASPNISVITPSGYGADWGSIGIGFGFQSRARFTDVSDGVFGIGFGLGDSQNLVGLQVSVVSADISDPFEDGSISVKLHRRLPEDFSIAVGVQGGATFGVTDGGSSVYGVVTKRFVLNEDVREPFSELYTSLGVGGGQFRTESDINTGVESVGVFGSVAIRVIEPISFITEWTGQDLTLGISIVPFRNLPFVIVPAITDVTGTAGDGTRFILGVGYSFSF